MCKPSLVLLSLLMPLLPSNHTVAQLPVITLQPGVSVEKPIGPGQTQTFAINLDENQYVQLVIDQRGVDVVVRAFSPTGRNLGEFDSPNGTNGPESVSFVAISPGTYTVLVASLNHGEGVTPGQYEIRIIELRDATEQELRASRDRDALKAKAIALISEVADSVQQIQQPQTRVRTQLQAADLLWDSNEKLALKLATDAMIAIKQYFSAIEISEEDYYQTYQAAMQLRIQVIQTVALHDPDMALSFLRATSGLLNPNGERANRLEEGQIELSLAAQVMRKDPKRAFEIAEANLKNRPTGSLIQTLLRLRSAAPDLATQLASDIAAKVQSKEMIKTPEIARLVQSLIAVARPGARSGASGANTPLLAEQEYRELVQKTFSEAFSFTPPASNMYTPERNSVQNLLNALRSLGPELDRFVPGGAVAVEKKLTELTALPGPNVWQQYQNSLNEGSTGAALETIRQAPPELQEQLYRQLSDKVAAGGDMSLARQLLSEHLTNPFQQRQALNNLDQQAIYSALAKGKVEDALRAIGNLRAPKMRAQIIARIATQIGPGQKRATALNLLETARSMIGTSVVAENQDQLVALLELSKAFSHYDAKRAFEIMEPLIEQFNEMADAAHTLDGFGQEYYQGGELVMQNGNSVASAASQLMNALGVLSLANFDRAKTDSDRIALVEVRLGAYVSIARLAIKQAR